MKSMILASLVAIAGIVPNFVRADAAADAATPIPALSVSFGTGHWSPQLQPTGVVVPIVIDVRSGKMSRDIAFGFGYALVFPRVLPANWHPGIDFLGGVQTGGNWNAAVGPQLGVLRVLFVVTHNNGNNYGGVGFGGGI